MTESGPKKIFTTSLTLIIISTLVVFAIISLFVAIHFHNRYELINLKIPNISSENRSFVVNHIDDPVRALAYDENPSTVDFQRALDNKAKNTNNFIKEKRNLNAQEGMWKVATELLILSAFQLYILAFSTIISFFGIYLLYKTLSATKDTLIAANSANEIARSTNRAWCDLFISDYALSFSDKDYQKFGYRILNVGSIPAQDVEIKLALVWKDDEVVLNPFLLDKDVFHTQSDGFVFHQPNANFNDVTIISRDKQGTPFFHPESKSVLFQFLNNHELTNLTDYYLVGNLSYSPSNFAETSVVTKYYEVTKVGPEYNPSVNLKEVSDLRYIE